MMRRLRSLCLALAVAGAAAWATDDPFAGLEGSGPERRPVETVRRGDSLEAIARRFYAGYLPRPEEGVRAIREANRLASDRLVAGQKLVVPFPFEGKARAYTAAADITLESVAAIHYAYADYPAAWWPLLYRANSRTVTRGGRKIRKSTELEIPPLPADRAARQQAAAKALEQALAAYDGHLESGDYEAAAEDRFLLLQGFIPLVMREVPGHTKKDERSWTGRIERAWQVATACAGVEKLASQGQILVEPDKFVASVQASVRQIEAADAAAKDEPVLAARLDRAKAKLKQHVGAQLAALVKNVPDLMAVSNPDEKLRGQGARSAGFQARYYITKLKATPLLSETATEAEARLAVELLAVPPPAPQVPAMTARVKRKDPDFKKSASIEHPKYRSAWFPFAVAYARGLWTGFPEARDQWGRPIRHEDVLRAIVMHESRGVHQENGTITKNENSPTSIDYGFGQINNAAHAGTTVKLETIARAIGDPAWTVARIASRDLMNVPAKDRGKAIALDFANPVHNLVAAVLVLSYSINNQYPATASPEEKLVKSLSGYNHGAFNRDYNEPWLGFVSRVDPRKSESGEISAVAYGIGMKLYLGMALDAIETDWWKRLHKTSLTSIFYLFADPYHGYAHYE